MLFNIDKLYFSPSPLTFWLSLCGLFVVLLFCALAIRNSLRKRRAITLEGLRFCIATLVVLLIWNPELRKYEKPKDNPVIAILYDRSYSMETIDAKVAKTFGNTGDRKIISRNEWLDLALDDSLWKSLEENGDGVKIIKQAFSPDDPSIKINKPGSNYNAPIVDLLKNNDNIKAVIILGDGDYNTGPHPSDAAMRANRAQVPIFTLPVGSKTYLPDLAITSLSAPKYGIVGESIQVPFTVKSTLSQDLKTRVSMTDKTSGKSESKSIVIPANGELNDSILWRLAAERTYNFELKVDIQNNEVIRVNNSQKFSLDAKKENIKVLVIETQPRWEYRFIRNALSRDPGVDVDCLLFHPKLGKGNGPDYIQEFPEDLAQLQKYDVIFMGDVGVGSKQLTIEQCDLLKGLVENQASGIVFIPGDQGNLFSLLDKDKEGNYLTSLADLLPVELDTNKPLGYSNTNAASLRLTDAGKGSLLTMLGDSSDQNSRIWRDLPGFHWYAAVNKAKIGADVLAVHSSKRAANNQRMPMLVTQTYGSGKVLFLAHDSAWKWRRGVEDLYHYRFWGQVARWMSYKRNRAAGENLRLHFSNEKPKPGDTVIVKANAFDNNGAPLQKGAVHLEITSPSGILNKIELEREDGAWGAYVGNFRIEESGTWNIESHTSLTPLKKIKTSIETLNIETEKIGIPASYNLLAEIADISGGEMLTSADDIPSLTEKINKMPPREPEVKSTNLRELDPYRWWIIGTVLTLLAIFWTGRKLNGTF